MAGELVLITGSNGAIGYEVVLHTLRAGYKVRAVVRKQDKADLILNARSIKGLDEATRERLSFAVVPDLLKPNAYDEALDGVVYVIHVASPIPIGQAKDFEVDMIQPAVQGTMNMLRAAEDKISVKRVVITSSVVAQIAFGDFISSTIQGTYTEASRAADPTGPYVAEPQAYLSSKALALNAAERWKKEQPRRIELVHVHPSLVLGRMELAQELNDIIASSSSGRVLKQALNQDAPPEVVSNTCWIEDVAEVHVRALNSNVPDGQSLVVASNTPAGAVWADGKDIIANRFPNAVAKGTFPNNGWGKTKVWNYDVSETEKLIGMKFAGFEKQITEVATQYLEMIGEEVA